MDLLNTLCLRRLELEQEITNSGNIDNLIQEIEELEKQISELEHKMNGDKYIGDLLC